MVGSAELSPVRSAGDMEGMTDEEEVLHDAHSNRQKILDLQERIKKVEAFDEEIQAPPLLKKDLRYQSSILRASVAPFPY